MHEQDVRRAVGRPGGMDTAPARHTAEYLAESLGFVLGKKVGAPAGTSLVLDMEGSAPFAFAVNDAAAASGSPAPPARADGARCAWTARRSSGWPAAAAPPSPAR